MSALPKVIFRNFYSNIAKFLAKVSQAPEVWPILVSSPNGCGRKLENTNKGYSTVGQIKKYPKILLKILNLEVTFFSLDSFWIVCDG